MRQKGHRFLDFYDVFEDEIYYDQRDNQLLSFRLTDKYHIDLPENSGEGIMQSLRKEKTVIVESKVRIPRGVIGKKPRDRRAYRKEKKRMLEQVTEHFSLRESLGELGYLAISSLS